MDTRFWGPSGWKLLHLISFDYTYSEKNAHLYAKFFECLPYILPCKFCRASLTDYYRKHPYKLNDNSDEKMNPDLDLKKWMYTIHNCVNDKLRKQDLQTSSNPKFTDIKRFYDKWKECDWQQHLNTFWDFLFAVAYNHPKETHLHSKPMPNCPPDIYKCTDVCEKNKWNLLSLRDKLYWFNQFWLFLPAVMPGIIGIKWNEVQDKNPPTLKCRRSTLAWLWRMRCRLDTRFKDPYTAICKKIEGYSSDCGRKKNTYTCRRRFLGKRERSKTRRRLKI